MASDAEHIEVAQAYVTIIPSLRGAQKAIAKELDPAAEIVGESAGDKAGKGIEGGVEAASSRAASKFRHAFDSASASMGESVSEKVGGAISKVGSSLGGIGDKLKASMPAVSTVAEGMGNAFSAASSKVGTMLGNVKGTVTGVADAVKTAFPNATAAASGAFDKLRSSAGSALEKLGNGTSMAFKGLATAATVGAAAAGAAIVATGKAALDSYAQYEQLSGGIKKLFGEEAAQTVTENAQNAYKTAGMSANQYMEQATTFSAALIKGLNGDTERAAQLTDVAIRAMSDNVNTFGTDAQSVQDAFNGFAKQNYTMLDNLKLGYAGTREGMVELIKDSGVLGEAAADLTAANLDEKVSFAQIVEAIQAVQVQQGIAGTTANEAATTIEGSVGMAKAAWSNWLTELGKDNADMETRTTELVDSIATAATNIVPRVAQIAGAIIRALPGLVAQVGSALGEQIMPMLDQVTGGVASEVSGKLEPIFGRVGAVFSDFVERLQPLAPVVQEIAGKVGEMLVGALDVAAGALEIVMPIIADAANVLLPAFSAALDVIVPIVGGIVDAMGRYVSALIEALQPAMEALAPVMQSFGEVLYNVGTWIGEHVMPVVGTFAEVMGATLGTAISVVVGAFTGLMEILAPVGEFIGGIAQGIGDAWDWLTGQVSDDSNAMSQSVSTSTADMKSAAVGNASAAASDVQKQWNTLASGTQSAYSSMANTVKTQMGGAQTSATSSANKLYSDVAKDWQSMQSATNSAYSSVNSTITSQMESAKSSAESSANRLGDSLSSTFDRTNSNASSAFSRMGGDIASNLNNTLSTSRSRANEIERSLEFGRIEGTANRAFSGVSRAASNEMNDAMRTARNGVNDIHNTLNTTFELPDFVPGYVPLPHFYMWGVFNPESGEVPGVGVDWYAKGGWFDGATLLGVGERGGEFVWPSYHPYIEQYADVLVESMEERGTGGVDIHDCTFVVREESDIHAVAEDLNDMINREKEGSLV